MDDLLKVLKNFISKQAGKNTFCFNTRCTKVFPEPAL